MYNCYNLVSTWGYLRYSANVAMWSRSSYILIWDTRFMLDYLHVKKMYCFSRLFFDDGYRIFYFLTISIFYKWRTHPAINVPLLFNDLLEGRAFSLGARWNSNSVYKSFRTCPVLFYKCIRIKGFIARVCGVHVFIDHDFENLNSCMNAKSLAKSGAGAVPMNIPDDCTCDPQIVQNPRPIQS